MTTVLKTAISALALGCAMSSAAMAADKKLTISVYSFSQDEYNEALYKPFEKICGCDVVVETGNSVERMAKIEANAANPVIDMAVMSTQDALSLARKGLIAPIDSSKLSNYDKLYDTAKDPIGDHMAVGYTYYATSIVYRKDLVDISSWSDLLGEDLAGEVALPNITTTQGPLALMMLGKALGHEDDYKPVISEIGKKSDDIVTYYSRSSELVQLMNQEEVIAAPVGRFAWASFKKSPLPFAWANPVEGQAGGMNVMVMTKGNGNEDLAYKFMDYWLSTEVQTKIANMLVDSPANKEVKVSDEVAENITYGADVINKLNIMPASEILDKREGWVEQWNNEVIR